MTYDVRLLLINNFYNLIRQDTIYLLRKAKQQFRHLIGSMKLSFSIGIQSIRQSLLISKLPMTLCAVCTYANNFSPQLFEIPKTHSNY